MILFITGLSSSGKTTTCNEIIKSSKGFEKFVLLDNDEVRKSVNSDLSFDANGRHENIRRVTEIACLLSSQGFNVLCAFTAPTNHLKMLAREIADKHKQKCFIVKLVCPLEVCATRNKSGLYERDGQAIIEKCGTPDMMEEDAIGLVDLYLDSSDPILLSKNVIKVFGLIKPFTSIQ